MYSGLYLLGAISSLGKTTFAHQIAEQIAMSGKNVLYFSLEQTKIELISKSIERIIYKKDNNTNISSLDIRKNFINDKVLDARKQYVKNNMRNLSIIDTNLKLSDIIKYIDDFIKNNEDIRPVIMVDYLQIIENDTSSKQNIRDLIDSTIIEFKKLSKKYNIVILIISSLNRSNYHLPIDFESFKESGCIEYTADVVWGLQLKIVTDNIFMDNKSSIAYKRSMLTNAKTKLPREIELVCLKNRFGISNYTLDFLYYPQYDLFIGNKIKDKHIKNCKPNIV